MGHDESAAIGGFVRKPLHRADCADFFCNPEHDAEIGFRAPDEVVEALEAAAERTGRTWNEQLLYTIDVCRGALSVPPDEERTANDWRILMTETTICLDGEKWIPFPYPPQMSKEIPQ